MVKNISIVLLAFLLNCTAFSQTADLKLKEPGHGISGSNVLLNAGSYYKSSDLPTGLFILGIITLISPMAVFEDKKVFFGLTKEVSFGRFPFGRISFEYSYIFRNYNSSHFRLSYNYDFVLESGDFMAIVVTPGAGYFTDTKNKGWFLQGSGGLLIGTELVILNPFLRMVAINPYLRYRHTFIKDKLKSDIDDISLGMAFLFYF